MLGLGDGGLGPQRDAQRVTVWIRGLALYVAHHRFVDFWNPPDIIERRYVRGRNTRLFVKPAVKFRVRVCPFEYPLELFQLKPMQFIAWQGLEIGVPVPLSLVHRRPFIRITVISFYRRHHHISFLILGSTYMLQGPIGVKIPTGEVSGINTHLYD